MGSRKKISANNLSSILNLNQGKSGWEASRELVVAPAVRLEERGVLRVERLDVRAGRRRERMLGAARARADRRHLPRGGAAELADDARERCREVPPYSINYITYSSTTVGSWGSAVSITITYNAIDVG